MDSTDGFRKERFDDSFSPSQVGRRFAVLALLHSIPTSTVLTFLFLVVRFGRE